MSQIHPLQFSLILADPAGELDLCEENRSGSVTSIFFRRYLNVTAPYQLAVSGEAMVNG